MSVAFWYCNHPLEPSGPHTYPEMVALKNHGIITPQTKVSCDGKQYLSIEVALGRDFLELGPLKPKPVEVTSGIGPVDREPEPDVVPQESAVKRVIGISGRVLAHASMIVTMGLATWEWDIPHMTRQETRHTTNVCRMYLQQQWYPPAAIATVLVLLVVGALLLLSYKNVVREQKISWIHTVLALIAFLIPASLVALTVLGFICDFILSLASIG